MGCELHYRFFEVRSSRVFATLVAILSARSPVSASPIDYLKTLKDVAQQINLLKKDFPQLAEFSPAGSLDPKNLSITYGYHTHRARHHGGWTAAVPNPDDDGVWFYLDFHDPNSMAQIHTQPVVEVRCLGQKRAFLLILEGQKTKALAGRIWAILEQQGAKPCKN